MVMSDMSSDCGVLGAFASKIRVWRSVGILFVLFRVYSENIPFFYGFQQFPGSSEHIRAAPPTHTHILQGCRTGLPTHCHITRVRHADETWHTCAC